MLPQAASSAGFTLHLPCAEQAWQTPSHFASQHTLSAQLPDAHWLLSLQVAPSPPLPPVAPPLAVPALPPAPVPPAPPPMVAVPPVTVPASPLSPPELSPEVPALVAGSDPPPPPFWLVPAAEAPAAELDSLPPVVEAAPPLAPAELPASPPLPAAPLPKGWLAEHAPVITSAPAPKKKLARGQFEECTIFRATPIPATRAGAAL